MIDSLILLNMNDARNVTLNRTDSDYLIDDNGLDWGVVSSQLSTINNMDGYGVTIAAINTAEPREIRIVGWVVGTEAQMAAKKQILKQVLPPQATIRVQIPGKAHPEQTFFIDAVVSKTLSFGNTVQTNNEVMCRFEIALLAAYPYFQYTRSYNNLSTGDSVINLGDIPVGAQLILTLSQAVTNPAFYVEMQGHRVGIFEALGDYPAGTQITVNTEYAAKQVSLDGQKDFSIMSTNYGWFYIPVSYSASDGIAHVSTGVSVSLQFNEAHTTLEDL